MPQLLEETRYARKSKWKLYGVVFLVVLGLILAMSLTMVSMKRSMDALRTEREELERQLEEVERINVSYVSNKLESISELACAKLTYNGLIHFEEGKIPLINKKEFYMTYRVCIKAGFDLTQAKVAVTEEQVVITMPDVEIYEPVIDESSIQFLDESAALFNAEKKTDLLDAIALAKEDVLAQPEVEELKETARKQAAILMEGLLDGQIGQRELVIQ